MYGCVGSSWAPGRNIDNKIPKEQFSKGHEPKSSALLGKWAVVLTLCPCPIWGMQEM